MKQINRREFLETAAATAGAVALGAAPALAQRKVRKPTDKVKLGKTGITASLIGIGSGTSGWNHQSNQTRLGQDTFTRIWRHAYDSGIRLFDCADQYGSHTYLREALKGLPRESYVIQTKSNSRDPQALRDDLDRFRKELGVDYIDIVLMHCVIPGDWNKQWQAAKDVLSEAKQKKIIRAHGCSCHSIEALEAAAADPWVEVDLVRFNPWGLLMDNRPGQPDSAAPDLVKPVVQKMHTAGKGVIGMKIAGEGRMVRADDRLARLRESIKFNLASGVIDCMVIGMQDAKHVDDAIGETRTALLELAEQKA